MKEKEESSMTLEFVAWQWVRGCAIRYRKQELVPGEGVGNESALFLD